MTAAELLEPWLVGPAGHVLAFVLGALFGSFGNVCIYRMPPTDEFPDGRSVVRPPSHCSVCKAEIAWYDNVPLVAYLWLRGRCRRCGTGFSPRYLLVEGATALLFTAVFHLVVVLPAGTEVLEWRLARFAILAAFVFVLVVIAFIDLDTRLILDRITYPAIPLFYLAGLALPEQTWWAGLVGIAVGYGVVVAVYAAYYLVTRRQGIGLGDAKLLALVGAVLGWPGVAVSLFLGSLIGSVVTLSYLGYLRLTGRGADATAADAAADATDAGAAATAEASDPADAADPEPSSIRHIEIPFGPFLCAGALAYLFLQDWLRVGFAVLYSE